MNYNHVTGGGGGGGGGGRDILLNVDLIGLTPVYMTYLDRWRPYFQSIEESFVRRLVYRYEYFWLPLLANWQQLDLEPPPDVHWVWQLHLLQPNHYAAYCKDKFGRILPHRIRKYDRESATALQRTASLWRDNYPGMPFEADLDYLRSGNIPPNESKLGDLVAVALNEKELAYQVDLPHYRDPNFQYSAVDRYKKLLLLKSLRPTENLRLPVDVQLIWRVHLLHPIQYAEDTKRIFGGVPFYRLGDMDFDAHAMLVADANNIWRDEFGDELFVEGTGYRGQIMTSRALFAFPWENYDPQTIETCEISVNNLTVDELWTKDKKIIIEAKLLGDNSFSQETIFRTNGVVGNTIVGSSSSAAADGVGGGGIGKTHFDTKRNRGLEFHIFGRKGLGCISRERSIANKLFNPVQYFPNLPSLSGGTQQIVLPKVTYTDPKITFEMTVKAASPKPHVFSMDRNQCELGPMPNDFRQFSAALQTWSVVATSNNSQYLYARHSLKCREAGIAFGVEVIKHDPTNLGAVLVYHNNQRLVAVAYSIDSTQLPHPNQVLETCPVMFDRHEGDHAMLIRNCLGDYAVCIARWQPSTVNGEGRIIVKTYFRQNRMSQTIEIRDDELQTIKTDSITVDMPTGKMTIDSTSSQNLPECIAWAFSVGILFVTCQKTSMTVLYPASLSNGSVRSAQWSSTSDPDSDSTGTTVTKKSRFSAKSHINQKKMAKRRKMSASFTFLLACGLQIDSAVNGGSSAASSRMSPSTQTASLRSNGPLPAMGEGGEAGDGDNVTFGCKGRYPTGQQQTKSNGAGLRNADSNPYSFHKTSTVLNSYPVYPSDPYEVLSGRLDNIDLTNSHPVQQVALYSKHWNDDGVGEHYVDVRL